MNRTTLLLAGILLITLQSCQKDNDTMTGNLEVHINSVARIENFSLYEPYIIPAENLNIALDMEWDNYRVRNNVKTYTTNELLTGTYVFTSKVRRSNSSGTYEVSEDFVRTFQILPGKTTSIELFFQ